MKNLWYVAHPFGGNQLNLDNAERWVRFLSHTFAARFWAPWVHVCRKGEGDPATMRAGLELDKICVALSEGVVAIYGDNGPSPGMRIEMARAKELGLPVVEISRLSVQGFPQELADELAEVFK